jgi:cytochrome c
VKYLFKILCVAACLIIISCQQDSTDAFSDRPHDPWIFRSVLDLKPRIITLALDDNLWAAYSTEDCSLYQAWKGVVNFDGAVYTTAHGPQPLSVGEKYVVNNFPNPWKLKAPDGSIVEPATQYKGHKVVNDQAVLMYELSHEDFGTINITEKVEAITNEKMQAEFSRTFTTSGVPEGTQVVMSTNFNSIVVKANILTDGEINYTKEEEVDNRGVSVLVLEGDLTLNSNATTDLTVTFMTNPQIFNPNFADEKTEDDDGIPEGLRLIAQSDCKTCHNKNVQTIGPAYVAIAERYPNTEENVDYLINKIKVGGTGIWGNQVMTPHPDLSETKIEKMVDYILSLREDAGGSAEGGSEIITMNPASIENGSLLPGLITKVYNISPNTESLADVSWNTPIIQAGVMSAFANVNGGDFKDLEDNFAIQATGFLNIKDPGRYNLRMWSDDGSRLYINNQLVVDNDGLHGTVYKEAIVNLSAGYYPIRIEYFQGTGGKFLSFNWKPVGAGEYQTVPMEFLYHMIDDRKAIAGYSLPMTINTRIPGDGYPLDDVHPGFNLYQARPNDFEPKVGGMDFFSDGRLAISTWDPEGAVYVIDNIKTEDPDDIKVTKIAHGLAEPLGLKIVNDEIYIMQKQELTRLVDNDGDGMIDEYRTICDDWKVSANFHEFGFGLEYKDGYFYASLATAIDPGGASTQPQIPDRGKVIKMAEDGSSMEFIATGLRTPNGIGWGYNDELFVCDNQGDWLPSSKVVHVTEGAWFGSRSVDFEGTAGLTEKKPLVWLPQDEIGNSPSTPSSLNLGPYQNQMIHGEVTHGGVKRVFVEEVDGQLQGALFRFIQGLEAGVNRLTWSPDGDLYVGGIGNPGNWSHANKLYHGLQRLEYNGNPTFEMLAVRARTDGIEIEFTQPLGPGQGWDVDHYEVKQWYYLPTIEYGGPKMDLEYLNIRSANVSDDRKKVFLQVDGIKENHVVYLRIVDPFISDTDQDMWSTEMWYTMNKIPANNPGFRTSPPPMPGDNELADWEKEAGWQLLFDGETTSGWRNFKKQTIGSSWKVEDGVLYLDSQKKDDGGWQAQDGGDIITDQAYENYEFSIEWKISSCGNSGIIFHVQESDEWDYVWQTGPEMQILDNTCHPDTKYPTHRAGDLYDMIETKYVTVKPAGEWNKVRILSQNGKVTFWQNDRKVVTFDMTGEEWKEMVANSKFKDMKGFGLNTMGHIALQDHGDPVYFKNIKIREL